MLINSMLKKVTNEAYLTVLVICKEAKSRKKLWLFMK